MTASFYISRRRFLQSTAAVATLTGLPRHAFAAEGDLIVRSPDPYNAEPALPDLVANRITPIEHFYVRNHGPTPNIDAATYKLRIEGLLERPTDYSLDQLKQRFSESSAEATLTCAGNRRQELSQIREVSGVQWDAGAIGHAQWTGIKLADVLQAAGIKTGAKHVWFDGQDNIPEKDGSQAPFGGSIPLEKALADDSPALLAHAMNRQPLTPEHGYPLRTLVPGYIGARSVKWLTKITLSDRPSPNHYVAEAYKLVQTDDKPELAAADPIYAFPINAAICRPAAGAMLKPGRTTVSGYALPSGQRGATIERVEISSDSGQTWTRASLSGELCPYTWQLWTAELNLTRGKHDLLVRATDSRGNSMPQRGDWNLKGYLYNAWHRVTVEVA